MEILFYGFHVGFNCDIGGKHIIFFLMYRLGSMWPGVEVKKGVYNATNLNELKRLVDKLEEKGIFVFLDCHQVNIFNLCFTF